MTTTRNLVAVVAQINTRDTYDSDYMSTSDVEDTWLGVDIRNKDEYGIQIAPKAALLVSAGAAGSTTPARAATIVFRLLSQPSDNVTINASVPAELAIVTRPALPLTIHTEDWSEPVSIVLETHPGSVQSTTSQTGVFRFLLWSGDDEYNSATVS